MPPPPVRTKYTIKTHNVAQQARTIYPGTIIRKWLLATYLRATIKRIKPHSSRNDLRLKNPGHPNLSQVSLSNLLRLFIRYAYVIIEINPRITDKQRTYGVDDIVIGNFS